MVLGPVLISAWPACVHAQVLANPSSELQEGTDISREQLKAVGIRPYDEKVRSTPECLPSHTTRPH